MVNITANHEQRRVLATVPPQTRWSSFHAETIAVVRASPVLTDYDWIIDDQGPMDDVDVKGMADTGEVFRKLASDGDAQTFTVVITSDRFFATWARVIDKRYGHRSHYAAPTLEAAAALLNKLSAERNCGSEKNGTADIARRGVA